MNISPTIAATGAIAASPVSTTSSSASTALSPNSFLTLLMAEMQNQDPTQPMDPTQMVSQLATISQVEQSVQTNTTLSSLLTASSLSQAEQLIGKTITSADGSITGAVVSVDVTNSGSTATLTNGTQVPLSSGANISGGAS